MPQKPAKPQTDSPAPTADDVEPRNFLQRWSQRKVEATTGRSSAAGEDTIDPSDPTSLEDVAESTSEPAAAVEEAPPEVTEADLENLTYDSDYTKFMSEHVPEAIRRQALRQLWRSDPILANLDGLCDYDDDYTDAALAVKVLKTAHKVGQGYLTDEEVAANRARGKPQEEDAFGHETAEDEVEDMEDFDDDGDTEIAGAVTVAASDDDTAEAEAAPNSSMNDTVSEPKPS